jgi:hypothetical protein
MYRWWWCAWIKIGFGFEYQISHLTMKLNSGEFVISMKPERARGDLDL